MTRYWPLFVAMLAVACAAEAQSPCSSLVRTDAAKVAELRANLRSIRVAEEEADDEVPKAAQDGVFQLKLALGRTARDLLTCEPQAVDPAKLESELATLLNANAPQPPARAVVTNRDKRYTEWLAFGYGRNLQVHAKLLSGTLLSVEFEFHIPCGDDHVLMIFEREQDSWQERLIWQAKPYSEISGAFGDIFDWLIVPSDERNPWKVVVVRGHPWCTSRFSGFDMELLEPTTDPVSPRVIWHTQRQYSRGDYPARLRTTADGFEFRVNAAALGVDDYERTVIYRYRVSGDNVTRVQPIATNGRGFVDEWLSSPWNEASQQTAGSGLSDLQRVHTEFNRPVKQDDRSFIQWAHGPVVACKIQGQYQVSMKLDRETMVPGKPGGDEQPLPAKYFLIQHVEDGYQMLSASAAKSPQCGGTDLMQPDASQ
jgi:hypothetical protein